jgi:hypothetical protein
MNSNVAVSVSLFGNVRVEVEMKMFLFFVRFAGMVPWSLAS